MDPVFDLISAGRDIPSGWGFPVPPGSAGRRREESATMVKLRGILLPLSDPEGLAQLYRWHYALLRSRKFVWRSISSTEGNYDPSAVFKAQLAVQGESMTAAANGFLSVGWQFAGETDALGGILERASGTKVRLKLGTFEQELPITFEGGIATIRWPEFMQASAALKLDEGDYTVGWQRAIAVRVAGFDAAGMVRQIDLAGMSGAFLGAGLLDSWFALPYPVDRVALAWLLLAMSEQPLP